MAVLREERARRHECFLTKDCGCARDELQKLITMGTTLVIIVFLLLPGIVI